MKKAGKPTRPFRHDLNQVPYDMEGTKSFKGLDLIERVPEKLWMEVCDIAQEAVIKIIPKKKKGKMVVCLTNSYEKKRSERQRRKGNLYPFECKVPKNSNREIKSSSVINAKK